MSQPAVTPLLCLGFELEYNNARIIIRRGELGHVQVEERVLSIRPGTLQDDMHCAVCLTADRLLEWSGAERWFLLFGQVSAIF